MSTTSTYRNEADKMTTPAPADVSHDDSSTRLPRTDAELRDVWEYVEHMLTHPEGFYDDMPLARLRRDVDCYLRGYRGETPP